MNPLSQAILVPHHLDYFVLTQDLKIIGYSEKIFRFLETQRKVLEGTDIREKFPELVGCENPLEAVFNGEKESFDLKGVTRISSQKTLLYLSFYFTRYQDSTTQQTYLVAFLEDITDQMSLEQNLVQSTNETSLLLNSLTRSHNYVNKIVGSMADLLIVTTLDGRIKTVNQVAQEVLEYPEAEIIGQPISLILKNEQASLSDLERYILFSGKLLKNRESTCLTKTGKRISVSFSCSLIQREDEEKGEFTTNPDIIYVGRDITERRRTQKRLAVQYAIASILSESTSIQEDTPEILRAICESLEWDIGELWLPKYAHAESLQQVQIWTRESKILSNFIEIAGRIQLLIGVGLAGKVWVTRFPQWISDLKNDPDFGDGSIAVEAGLQSAFAFPIQSDGEMFGVMTFFCSESQPLDRELLGMMLATGNQLGQFVKRKQLEEQYRDLFENATDLIQSVAPDGSFLYVNRAWRETLGYSEAEVRQMSSLDVIHPNCLSKCQEIFQQVMAGKRIKQVQAEFVNKEGKKVTLEGNINCKFVNGQPVATRAIFRDITARLQVEEDLRQQQEQTERLLLNILPQPIAERLKRETSTIADSFDEVTVLFADLVGFTEIASNLPARQLVKVLNEIFSEFDLLTEIYGLEKIKTIGDAYMVVGGLPMPRADHADAIAQMALEMQKVITQFNHRTGNTLSIRIGINSGSVVAGVMGTKKFIYDLWGDTVNIASRMESHAIAGTIQVTAATYERLQHHYHFENRGVISIKGKGEMPVYLLIGTTEAGGRRL